MRRIALSSQNGIREAVGAAVEVLRRGGLVVFPTETVYGLAADALDESAVHRIFHAKSRRPDKPIPVMIADLNSIDTVARDVPQSAHLLGQAFWPGPLTVVLWRGRVLPNAVTAGGDTVGVRIPAHPVALEALRCFGGPLAVTSANVSDKNPAVDADEAAAELGESIDLLIDGGRCQLCLASTVVDLTSTPPRVLRTGAINPATLSQIIGDLE